MTCSSWCTLVSLAIFFLGERSFGTNTVLRVILDVLAAILLVWAVVDRFRKMGRAGNDDTRVAHKRALILLFVTIGGLLCYALTLDTFVDLFGLSDTVAPKWRTAFSALVPVLVLASLVPMLLVDRAIVSSPARPHPLRVRNALEGGLVAVFSIAMLFPLNYLGKELNKRWDVTYFKTTEAGSSTRAIIDNLDKPVQAVLFFPTSSDVEEEVRPYFESLAGPNFTVTVADNALDPELAKLYKVKDNGEVALVMGEKSESVKVGTDLDKAKKTLKKLDSEVGKALIKLAKGDRVAYFTTGHGEMSWTGQGPAESKIANMKKILEALNFKVKELGLGQGLASNVPDDASVVFIMGPDTSFMPEEVETLDRYIDRGGKLFVSLAPNWKEGFDPNPLIAQLGLKMDPTLIVTDEEKTYVPVTNGKADRQYLGTNRYSSHESVTTLSRSSSQAWMVVPTTGSLVELPDHRGKVTVTVRSLAKAWADANGNFEYDKNGESRKSWDLAAAASGPTENGGEYRAIVFADADWAADRFVMNKANAVFAVDGLHWLVGEEELAGTTNDEEDVKIVHTKENQRTWFYGTTFAVPLLLGGLGLVRVYVRKKKNRHQQKNPPKNLQKNLQKNLPQAGKADGQGKEDRA
jgi:hypothetical protein